MQRTPAFVGLCLSISVPSAIAQAPLPSLSFEAASLKPAAQNTGVSGGCRGIDSKLAAEDQRTARSPASRERHDRTRRIFRFQP